MTANATTVDQALRGPPIPGIPARWAPTARTVVFDTFCRLHRRHCRHRHPHPRPARRHRSQEVAHSCARTAAPATSRPTIPINATQLPQTTGCARMAATARRTSLATAPPRQPRAAARSAPTAPTAARGWCSRRRPRPRRRLRIGRSHRRPGRCHHRHRHRLPSPRHPGLSAATCATGLDTAMVAARIARMACVKTAGQAPTLKLARSAPTATTAALALSIHRRRRLHLPGCHLA